MKQKIIILSMISLFMLQNSCQNDDFKQLKSQSSESDLIYKKIPFKSLDIINPKVSKSLGKVLVKLKEDNKSKRGPNIDNNYKIDSTSVVSVSNELGYSSYTFSVIPENKNVDYLQNIVITSYDGEIGTYLAEYTLNTEYSNLGNDYLNHITETKITPIANPNLVYGKASAGSYGDLCFTIGYHFPVNKCEGDNVTPGDRPECFGPDGKPLLVQVMVIVATVCSESVGGGSNTAPAGVYPGYSGPTGNPMGGGGLGTGGGTSNPIPANPNSGNINPVTPENPNPQEPIHSIGDVATSPTLNLIRPLTPCSQLKSLFTPDPDNTKLVPNLKPSIVYLKGKVNDAIEHGIEVKKVPNYDDNLEYVPETMTGGTPTDVPFNLDIFHIIWMHTHPFGTSHGMFSYGDVKLLCNGYKECGETRKEEVTVIVICKNLQGVINTYAIKVDNIQTLTTKVDAFMNNYATTIDLDEKMLKIHKEQAKIYARSGDDLEKSFLQQFGGYGISLYKANQDLTNWSKLDLASNPASPNQLIVQPTPCN